MNLEKSPYCDNDPMQTIVNVMHTNHLFFRCVLRFTKRIQMGKQEMQDQKKEKQIEQITMKYTISKGSKARTSIYLTD